MGLGSLHLAKLSVVDGAVVRSYSHSLHSCSYVKCLHAWWFQMMFGSDVYIYGLVYNVFKFSRGSSISSCAMASRVLSPEAVECNHTQVLPA